MDEILASIRRIIESGDERTPAASQGSARTDAGSPTETAPEPQGEDVETGRRPLAEATRSDVHYLPSALGDQSQQPSASIGESLAEERMDAAPAVFVPVVEAPNRADSLAEPARDAAVLPERAVDPAAKADAQATAEATVAPKAGNENSSRSGSLPTTEPVMSPADFAFEFNDEQFEAALRNGGWDDEEEARPTVGSALEELHAAAEGASASARRMPESVIDGASALLSTEAGDQVASAFTDLARAIRDGHMRSMEEMAREMMRPMLQEWLDDNLPRIVERLVREEIERVARGARY